MSAGRRWYKLVPKMEISLVSFDCLVDVLLMTSSGKSKPAPAGRRGDLCTVHFDARVGSPLPDRRRRRNFLGCNGRYISLYLIISRYISHIPLYPAISAPQTPKDLVLEGTPRNGRITDVTDMAQPNFSRKGRSVNLAAQNSTVQHILEHLH